MFEVDATRKTEYDAVIEWSMKLSQVQQVALASSVSTVALYQLYGKQR